MTEMNHLTPSKLKPTKAGSRHGLHFALHFLQIEAPVSHRRPSHWQRDFLRFCLSVLVSVGVAASVPGCMTKRDRACVQFVATNAVASASSFVFDFVALNLATSRFYSEHQRWPTNYGEASSAAGGSDISRFKEFAFSPLPNGSLQIHREGTNSVNINLPSPMKISKP
jgi:hypothetical protein